MNWHNFKTDPPYDAYEDDKNGLETDFTYVWFTYRYTNRPHLEGQPFVSHKACKFSQGLFEGYEGHMKTSPYPEDRITVLAWVEEKDVKDFVLKSFNEECNKRVAAALGWQ